MLEKIDLLKYQKRKHRKKKIVATLTTIVFLVLGSVFVSFKLFYASKELGASTGFFRELAHLVTSPERDITAGKKNINILILGMGGAGHEGPYLTDTMLVASINKAENKIAMTSIPRDLLVDTNKFGKKKINHLNSYAELEKEGSGAKYTKDVLEEILHIPIDYYARMDFNGFEQMIDIVDGIDVDVPRTFIDPLFPREQISSGRDSGTMTVTFEKGMQHMDGKTALIYARSRHGNNGEGNDFARSRRQQQIILALKDKILSSETLLSVSKINQIIKSLKEHVDTDISAWEAIQLAKTYQKLNITPDKIAVNVLTSGPNGPLYSDYYNEQYVLLPKKEDWSDIREIANNPFEATIKKYTGNYSDTSGVSLVILNGTKIGGLAGLTALTLEDFGFTIKDIGNSPNKDFEKSVIYNITTEDKKDALMEIKRILHANVAQSIPLWLKETIKDDSKPDFIIITGQQISQSI
ncbi:LCP family protein [Patescibacteria group bacterium]|nr:LCP family protein [Patescibacteria group bacterium]